MPRREEPSTLPQVRPSEAKPATPPSAPPTAAPLPKRLGRYEVLFELERGGMGTVYVGRLVGEHGFDRLVAIKQLSAQRLSDEDRAAFLREARLTARISHPNVVATLELGEDHGAPFLVMQLVEGVSLARLVDRLAERGDAIDPDLAAWIGAQAAAGLHAAHEVTSVEGERLGVVHRDVSPQNLLLSFDGRVYVADFGVAKLVFGERATQSGVLKGKFAYMSPEQTRALALDRRSDVFSLGIVLHEALTGRMLFDAGAPAETIRRICELEAPNPGDVRPGMPNEIVPIVLRCLEKRAEDRFQSAGELAEALRAALRARRAVVDDGELATLLGDLFAAERDALKARIRSAVFGQEMSTERGAGRPSEGSVTAAVRAALPRRGRLAGTTAALVAAAGIALAVVGVRARTNPPTVAEDAVTHTISVNGAPTPPLASAPPPESEPAAAPAPSQSASAVPSPAPTAAKQRARATPPAAPLPATTPTLLSPTTPTAEASSRSVRGVPFRDVSP